MVRSSGRSPWYRFINTETERKLPFGCFSEALPSTEVTSVRQRVPIICGGETPPKPLDDVSAVGPPWLTGATGITTLGLVGQGAALWRCTGTAGDASVSGPTVVNSWHNCTRLWLQRLMSHVYWQVAHSIPLKCDNWRHVGQPDASALSTNIKELRV